MNTVPKKSRRTSLHRFAGFTGAIALALAGAIIPLSSAQATVESPFSIDGTVPDAGMSATPPLTDAFGNVKELGPKNASSTKIGVIHSAATPMLDNTNPNAQVDLRGAWLTTAKDTSNHTWLYFAWERDSNSGSGFIAYEFMHLAAPTECAYDTATAAQLTAGCNPWKNRRAGDFMILWDQSGSNTALVKRTWSGTYPNLTLGGPVTLTATEAQAKYSANGFRGEASVDLTATVFTGDACQSFANTIPSTVTGNSDTADYKDTILKQTPPISNCTSSVVTTPKKGDGTAIPAEGLSLGTGTVAVKDSATVSLTGGTASPAGSVAFYLCKVAADADPNTCVTGGTSVGSTSLTDPYPSTVLSPSTNVTDVGRYCWRAVYSGDAANGIPSSSDSSANECFTINAVPASLTTAQRWVPNDSATISASAGGSLAGTASFGLYANNTCTGTALYSEDVPVAGASPEIASTSNTTARTASGSFWWKVSYDSTNPAQLDIAATCTETSSLTITN